MFDIAMSDDPEKIRDLVADGWCPVECAFGGMSITDELLMDHHGDLAHLESVAIRALRDHSGARRLDPRFVLTGVADADATFAIAALAGILPGSDFDLGALACTIALMDTDPIGRDVCAMPAGDVLQCWNALFGGGRDRLAAFAAVEGWRRLTTPPQDRFAPFIGAAKEAAKSRRAQAALDLEHFGRQQGLLLSMSGSSAPAFDVWYGRKADQDAALPSGWSAPIIISHAPSGAVSISCPNQTVAECLFGEGGLLNVFPLLSPPGWGGRGVIGGSPRGLVINGQELSAATAVILAILAKRGA